MKCKQRIQKFCLKVKLFFLQGNIQFWGIFRDETLFQKLWPLLYKRAELDLRSTKMFITIQLIGSALKTNPCILPRGGTRLKHLEKNGREHFWREFFSSFSPILCDQQRAISSNNPIFKKEGAMPKVPEIESKQIKSCEVLPLCFGHQQFHMGIQ